MNFNTYLNGESLSSQMSKDPFCGTYTSALRFLQNASTRNFDDSHLGYDPQVNGLTVRDGAYHNALERTSSLETAHPYFESYCDGSSNDCLNVQLGIADLNQLSILPNELEKSLDRVTQQAIEQIDKSLLPQPKGSLQESYNIKQASRKLDIEAARARRKARKIKGVKVIQSPEFQGYLKVFNQRCLELNIAQDRLKAIQCFSLPSDYKRLNSNLIRPSRDLLLVAKKVSTMALCSLRVELEKGRELSGILKDKSDSHSAYLSALNEAVDMCKDSFTLWKSLPETKDRMELLHRGSRDEWKELLDYSEKTFHGLYQLTKKILPELLENPIDKVKKSEAVDSSSRQADLSVL